MILLALFNLTLSLETREVRKHRDAYIIKENLETDTEETGTKPAQIGFTTRKSQNLSLFVWLLILNKRKGTHMAKIKGSMLTHTTRDKAKEKGDQDPLRFSTRKKPEM
jgi:hypothetical protein